MSVHTLMFGWEYPPLHSGGLGVACQGIVRGLLSHGAGITLVLPVGSPEDRQHITLRSMEESQGDLRFVDSALQPYERAEEYAGRIADIPVGGGGVPQDLYGPDLGNAVERFTEQAVAVTEDVRADIIHCHDWMTYEAGKRASSYHRIPLVAHVHATELDRTDFHPNPWIADRERLGLLAADRIIAVSNYTKNMLVQHYGLPPNRIAVVHNSIESIFPLSQVPIPHPQSPTPPLILFVGRLTVQKNPLQFLAMARIVRDHRPDALFCMAGGGPMLQALVDRARELDLEDAVTFAGNVGRAEINRLYRSARCFVMPSISEPFGLVALEAVAHGVPVVLSKQSGAAEVIDHAFTVDYWDTEKFADCVLTVLREEPLAEQLRSEAPRVLQRLSWKNQTKQILAVYRDAMTSF